MFTITYLENPEESKDEWLEIKTLSRWLLQKSTTYFYTNNKHEMQSSKRKHFQNDNIVETHVSTTQEIEFTEPWSCPISLSLTPTSEANSLQILCFSFLNTATIFIYIPSLVLCFWAIY